MFVTPRSRACTLRCTIPSFGHIVAMLLQGASTSAEVVVKKRRSTRERSQPKQVYVPCWKSTKTVYLGGDSRRPAGKLLVGDGYQ
eukprot:349632-Chlamydomonas_euryale.AAC.1